MKYIAILLILLSLISCKSKTQNTSQTNLNQNNPHKTELSSTNTRYLHKIGMKYYSKKNYKIALSFFKRILMLNSTDQNALYNCACMNALLGKVSNTINYLKKLFKLNAGWKKKLKPGAEKDFRTILNSPEFTKFRNRILAQNNQATAQNQVDNNIIGTYLSVEGAREHAGGNLVYSSLTITASSVSINLEPNYGELYNVKIKKWIKLGHNKYRLIVVDTYYTNPVSYSPVEHVIEVSVFSDATIKVQSSKHPDANNMTWKELVR